MVTLEANLKATIKLNKSIRGLATNPLLCAMICALHRDRYQHLPTRRTVLYDAACRMLLEERDKRRDIDLEQYPKLDYEQKRALLQKLAYWMLRNKRPQATKAEAEHQFRIALQSLRGVENTVYPAAIYKLFTQRSGIVHETAVDVLDFIHRTFLEYLAAVAIVDERDIGVLISNAEREQWREVIILAAGIADNQGRNELLRELVNLGDKHPDRQASMYLLAASCLESVVTIEPQLRSEIETKLQLLIPPQSLEAARSLAAAGDLAAPHLFWKEEYSANTATYCIRALSEIKSDLALSVLSTFTSDTRRKVVSQLTKAWQAFDKREFAETVLSKAQELIFDGQGLVADCHLASHVRTIRIRNNDLLTDLQMLYSNTALTELELQNCPQLTDISTLSMLTHIKKLTLAHCQGLSDISALRYLAELEHLVLFGSDNIDSLGVLCDLVKLRVLDIRKCDKADLSMIVDMQQLEILLVSNVSFGDAIQQLRELRPDLKVFVYPT